MTPETRAAISRYMVIVSLVIAGETIFSLPFHVARFFRPTLLEVFGYSNAQLGDVFAVYGVTAMLAYFPGGAIADHFSARKLITTSLLATAAGGLFMATLPGVLGMSMLFAYWGVTTILLFWAAMIRATREWGGEVAQGKAFGLLDGGRGLVAAVTASMAVTVLGLVLPSGVALDNAARREALLAVIYFYTAVTFGAGVLAWRFIPDSRTPAPSSTASIGADWGAVLRLPVVWLQAVVVICAYCGYKGLDNYSLYAVDVLGMNEVDAARFTAMSAYIRVVAAIGAGWLADRYTARGVIGAIFAALTVSYGYLAFGDGSAELLQLTYANIFVTFVGVYGLRGVYFALLQETAIPAQRTGTAVGLISLVGFTPDIFFAPIAGRLLDASPGVAGQQHFFALLTAIATAGVVCTVVLSRAVRRENTP